MTSTKPSPNSSTTTNGIKGSEKTWGLWERLVPDETPDDPASQSIMEIHMRRYHTANRYVPGKRVLDIASGAGYGSQMMKQAGATSVIGVDLSETSLEYARQHYATPGVEFIHGNAEEFTWQHKFDVIVSYETIEHLPTPSKFLARIHDLLTPEGTFLLSVPLGETRHMDKYHLHAFSREDIFTLFDQAGFTITHCRTDEWFVPLSNLRVWRKQNPDSSASFKDLLFTQRGRKLLLSLIKAKGFDMPQLVVAAQLKSSPNSVPQSLLPLE
jgi:SAM-dependent methyltransferase